MYKLLRPLLYRLNPEHAHTLTLHALRIAGNFPISRILLELMYQTPSKPIQLFGLTFKNQIGLAAGYDKDGLAIRGLAALGFGHVEIGTVTPKPQPGNPSPRVFRLVEDEAVINRMGFPSRGAEFVKRQLRGKSNWNTILGVNIGKNKETPNEAAVLDYLTLLQNFADTADYLTINVSSPNTVGLRALQESKALNVLLTELHVQRQIEEKRLKKNIPLLVKISSDLSYLELDATLETIMLNHIDGLVISNSSVFRENIKSASAVQAGGISGRPLSERSTDVINRAYKLTMGKIPIIGVGGIITPNDAKEKLDAGASLIQVYTGLIYAGPMLVKKTIKSIN